MIGEYTPCGHELTIAVNDDRSEAEIRIDGTLVATIQAGAVDGEVTVAVPFKQRCVARVAMTFGGQA